MSKLLKLGAVAAIAFAVSLPISSYAQPAGGARGGASEDDSAVTANFKNVGRAMRGFARLEGDELAEAMGEVRQYLVGNGDLTPDLLAGSSAAEVAGFHADLKYALGLFDAAYVLAGEGESDSAKVLIAFLDSFHDEMHEKYGVE